MANVKNNKVNIVAKIQLSSNLGLSAEGSVNIDSAVTQTQDANGEWNAVGWFYDEASGVLTVYFNAVPSDDGAQLLTNIQTVYPSAAWVS